MRQVLTIPIKTTSENGYRRMQPMVRAQKTKRMRETLQLILQAELQRVTFPFRCRIVRLSAGTLDHDNLLGALKTVRDSIARFAGVDDADPIATWLYDQEKVPMGTHGIRIELEDDQEGGDHARDLLARNGAKPKRKASRKAAKAFMRETVATMTIGGETLVELPPEEGNVVNARGQVIGRTKSAGRRFGPPPDRSFAVMPVQRPHDQKGELWEIPGLDGNTDPPREIRVPAPGGGVHYLQRSDTMTDPELGLGWLYRGAGDPIIEDVDDDERAGLAQED